MARTSRLSCSAPRQPLWPTKGTASLRRIRRRDPRPARPRSPSAPTRSGRDPRRSVPPPRGRYRRQTPLGPPPRRSPGRRLARPLHTAWPTRQGVRCSHTWNRPRRQAARCWQRTATTRPRRGAGSLAHAHLLAMVSGATQSSGPRRAVPESQGTRVGPGHDAPEALGPPRWIAGRPAPAATLERLPRPRSGSPGRRASGRSLLPSARRPRPRPRPNRHPPQCGVLQPHGALSRA